MCGFAHRTLMSMSVRNSKSVAHKSQPGFDGVKRLMGALFQPAQSVIALRLFPLNIARTLECSLPAANNNNNKIKYYTYSRVTRGGECSIHIYVTSRKTSAFKCMRKFTLWSVSRDYMVSFVESSRRAHFFDKRI